LIVAFFPPGTGLEHTGLRRSPQNCASSTAWQALSVKLRRHFWTTTAMQPRERGMLKLNSDNQQQRELPKTILRIRFAS
jgi:hypothetical protein